MEALKAQIRKQLEHVKDDELKMLVENSIVHANLEILVEINEVLDNMITLPAVA